MEKGSKIYIAGHAGLVGSALLNTLRRMGYSNIICASKNDLDLRNQADVNSFFSENKPEFVFMAAAKVGGILANSSQQADFIHDNLMISSNIIAASYGCGVKKLLNLGSSCIYPKMASQPIKEEYLLTGPLEPTNEGYAIAKIAAIKLCRYFNEQYGTNNISVMPTNLYGPNDNFNLNTSHVLPALLRKFVEAKENKLPFVEIWGDGTAQREFLYVDDLADILIKIMNEYDYVDIGEIINIGTGKDISILDLAELMKRITGYEGELKFDRSKPNGTPRKVLDLTRLSKLGWSAKVDLESGIGKTLNWYYERYGAKR
jgi:GDP-L-fucose synthase